MNPLTYFWIFLKASLFSTGGYGNLPSLHQDLLAAGLANEQNFSQSLAVGQLSPGPNGLWSVALGYMTYGVPGAVLALLGQTLPPLLVLGVEAVFDRIATRPAVQGALRGLTLAIVGLVLVVGANLLTGSGYDWRVFVIAFGILAAAISQRFHILTMLGLAGLAGLILFSGRN